MKTLEVGSRIKVKKGADAFMNKNGFATADAVDNKTGIIVENRYTEKGPYDTVSKHYGISFETGDIEGIHPDFVELDATPLQVAAEPLIKYLCENYHPHVTAIVTGTSVEVLEGVEVASDITKFLKD